MASDDELVVIGSFNSKLAADVARAKLASSGVPSVIRSDNLGGTVPAMGMATGGYELLVLAPMAGEATGVLDEHEEHHD